MDKTRGFLSYKAGKCYKYKIKYLNNGHNNTAQVDCCCNSLDSCIGT